MDLGEEGNSPWGDEPGRTPTQASTPVKKPEEPKETTEPLNGEPQPAQSPTVTTTAPKRTPGGRGGRGPRRAAAQATRLEAVDDTLGPLGPLGQSAQADDDDDDEPPELPKKENQIQPSPRPSSSGTAQPRARAQPPKPDEDQPSPYRGRFPPGTPSMNEGASRPASLSVEQAAKPSFNITVGDPHKVGDLTSSHTVFQVRTKTTSKAYRVPEFEVSRRYRDFLWLYNQLHSNNPGVVVPPPPEKQAVGRFDTNFVESRRQALERMLNKTAAHSILQHDGDLKLFLESESFSMDKKDRDRKDPDMPESKGMFSSLNLSVGNNAKFVEQDDWFLERRFYLDTLEAQLKQLLKATDTAIAQRKALSEATAELSVSLNELSQVELSPTLTGPLASLSDLQLRIRDLYDRQAQQDVLTLGITIDEYIRLIGSIKKAFEQRQRSWQSWHNAETDLSKRRSALDKLMRQGRSQQDKMSQLQADVGDAERRAVQAKLQFDDLGRGMRGELERFEREKVEDFRMSVETYLESAVEAQKELIELWETYLYQLDADEAERDNQPPLGDQPDDKANVPSSQPTNDNNEQSAGIREGEQTALPERPAEETPTELNE